MLVQADLSGPLQPLWSTPMPVHLVAGGSGTVPMHLRRDPMPAAAEAISAIESICTGSHEGADLPVEQEALVCTVGRLHVHPNQVRDAAHGSSTGSKLSVH